MEHRCGVDYPRCPGCQERIAELEAELAESDAARKEDGRDFDILFDKWQFEMDRAEKAEAEVERLRAYSARADAATVRMGKKLEDAEMEIQRLKEASP